jgi:short-subunit dehydrogenase
MDVRERHVLLTGASGGIGAALAARLADAGARLTLVARESVALKQVAVDTGGFARPTDLLNLEDLPALIAEAEAVNGPVDVLINNAGVEVAGYLPRQRADEVATVLGLNLHAPIELCRQLLQPMVARGRGHIMNVSSFAGVATFPGLAVYGASKAGLSQFTAGLRADLRGLPIGTTLVELGPVLTPMLQRAKSYPPTGQSFDRLRRWHLLNNLTADEVADVMARALGAGRSHVRLPRRGAVAPRITELPRATVSLLLTGIAHRDGR